MYLCFSGLRIIRYTLSRHMYMQQWSSWTHLSYWCLHALKQLWCRQSPYVLCWLMPASQLELSICNAPSYYNFLAPLLKGLCQYYIETGGTAVLIIICTVSRKSHMKHGSAKTADHWHPYWKLKQYMYFSKDNSLFPINEVIAGRLVSLTKLGNCVS